MPIPSLSLLMKGGSGGGGLRFFGGERGREGGGLTKRPLPARVLPYNNGRSR